MSKPKQIPRAHIAMNMISDLFLNSISRYNPLAKLPKLNEVQERLKQRALAAIKSKSPQDRKISVTKASQLGPGNLWKGLDLVPQKNSKSPGNQQRLQTSINQTTLTPQQRRYQTLQNNTKNQKQLQTRVNQNSPKKPIQRQHNRIAENDLNDSRYRIQTKQVKGNMVSQNLIRNQKSVRDDFSINEKQADKKVKFSNENEKSGKVESSTKNINRNMTQSRALNDAKQKRVSFSPQKPKQHTLQKKQTIQIKKVIQVKPIVSPTPKNINTKQQPYVYVPPQKRIPKTEQENVQHQHSQSLIPPKTQKIQPKIQVKNPPYQSLSPPKQTPIKTTPTVTNSNIVQRKETVIKIKSRQQILAEQQKNKKPTNPVVSPTYVYQPVQKPIAKPEQIKIQSKKVIIQTETRSIQKRTQVTPKKVDFNLPSNNNKSVQPIIVTPRPVNKVTINRTVVIQDNIKIKKNVTMVKVPANTQQNNVSLDVSAKSKSPQKNQTNGNINSRKKAQVSAQQMKKDWNKIKDNLKYDGSYSPQNKYNKNIPERQDIALKMLAQIFLDASTRYFPGLSMLLKRGISKQQIDQMRSKSSQFKINVFAAKQRSPSKPQPKTQRKLNWKDSQNDKDKTNKQKQNNRMYQGDVTATQYRIKKPEQIEKQKKADQQKISKSQVQQKPQQKHKPTNIVSQSLEKNNKRMTRDDSILDKHTKQPSERSNSIRQSPDVYHRQTSKKDVQDSKKDLAKLKIQASKKQQNTSYSPSKKQQQSSYVYQPPSKRTEIKIQEQVSKKIQISTPIATIVKKPEPKIVTVTPSTKPTQKNQKPVTITQKIQPTQPIQHVAPVVIKKQQPQPIIKVQPKQTTNKLVTSKSQTSIILPPQKQQPKPVPKQNQNNTYSPSKRQQTSLNKKQQSSYVYQPPTKWQPRPLSPQQKTQIKPSTQTSSKQLIQSRSQTSILQPQPQKPVINQPVKPAVIQPVKPIIEQKKNVNYGQNTPKNSQIKPKSNQVQQKPTPVITPVKPQLTKIQEKKQQTPNASQKNISIISSKSQTSLVQPPQDAKQDIKKLPAQNTKTPQASTYVYQPTNKKDTSTGSSYVYQPTTPIKKDNNIGTHPNLPAKNQNSQTLRSVQSQKTIKTIDNTNINKNPQPVMIKKQQKVITATVQKQNNVTPSTNKSNTQTKVNQKIVDKTITQTETKQPTVLSKRFCTIIALVLKKRLSQNYAFSLQKIQEQSHRQYELLKQCSFLNRSLTTFSHNYEKILKRDAFKLIKTFIITSVNKIIKENKPVEENHNFSSGRKQSASRIIFWLLKDKLASYLQPLRQQYLKIKNQGKSKQAVIQAMARVYDKRALILKKDGFKAIKIYKNQRQAVLQNFANILSKIKYTAVSTHFSTFVQKDIKQLGAAVKQLKQLSPNKTLSKSKSQQFYSSTKLIKEESSINLNLSDTQKLSPADEAKLQSKRKELQRKTNDLQNRKENLQQEVNNLNKDKRAKTKKNAQLKLKLTEIQKQLQSQESVPMQKTKSRENALTQQELIPILTRIYAYLFQDSDNTQIVVQRFLSDNQHCFQLPTNPALLNEWKVINKNAQLKRLVKLYQGQQPRQKRICQVLQEQNNLMGKLLRSFVRQRYIWQWVNIIAHE